MSDFCRLKIQDFYGIRANFHTHTYRCMHAVGTDRDYVENAIRGGYKVLGFSDHTPLVFDDDHISPVRMTVSDLDGYFESLTRLRDEYKNDIDIYIGFEVEYLPGIFENTLEELKKYPVDYMILGQHYLTRERGVDYTANPCTDEERLSLYVERVKNALSTGLFMYTAHPDVINYQGNDEIYESYMTDLANVLKFYDFPNEINVNGFKEGKNYPDERFIRICERAGLDFIIGVDAHQPQALSNRKMLERCMKLTTKTIKMY